MQLNTLDKQYTPTAVEDDIYAFWMEGGFFHAQRDPNKRPYTIVMPPPNVTGQLHAGHAMDMTAQDIIIRFKRMQGYAALWLPGTDHASIATEAKVVEAMREEGLTKEDLGRDGFLERAWAWKNKYGSRITSQLRKLGASCDWQRERFTMDDGCSDAVREVFVRLYDQKLIYRGNRMVNWCPKCQTSISDAEVEYAEKDGHFWHLLYPVEGTDETLELATTRPETMLGDTAVAINPEDERYAHLHGKYVILPLVGRRIPIVCDEHADMTKGTGVVKITPAHDPNDFEVGERHALPRIRVMTYDGHMTGAADAAAAKALVEAGRAAEGEPEVLDCGKYAGMTTAQARKAILEDLEAIGALKATEPLRHDVGSCYRCHTTIEPMVSQQWFVRMAPLAEPAIQSVEAGEIRFVPERFTKNYLNWMRSTRDWCISRQLWWGHQIPAWYCDDCGHTVVAKEAPTVCPVCGSTHLTQDPDTLDTWFSSALWPFSTLGWPDENSADLQYFYPTNTLVTGYDIIGFWVSRMIFSGLAYTGKAPFDTVCIHGIMRDELGRKMSKSLGNGFDPLEVIEQYGADALRFMLVDGSTPGNDMRYSERKVQAARNFANKLWNATRFVLMNLQDDFTPGLPAPDRLTLADKWVLSTLNDVIAAVTDNLEKFEMGLAAAKVQDFIWDVYCDWFIEIAKVRLTGEDAAEADAARRVLVYVLDMALRLLHPFMPFITEKLYQALPGAAGALMMQPWPVADAAHSYPAEEEDFGRIMALIKAVRTIRTDMNVHPAKRTSFIIETATPDAFAAGTAFLQKFAFATDITLTDRFTGDAAGMVQVVTDAARAFIPLAELIDKEKELARLQKELEGCLGNIASLQGKLANENFLAKAPAHIVEDMRAKLAAAQSKETGIRQSIAALG